MQTSLNVEVHWGEKKMNSRTSVLILYAICSDVFPIEMTDVFAADEI